MIHYSCDHCGRSIDPEHELRYQVKLEVCAAIEPLDVNEAQDDRDHLTELHRSFEKTRDAELDGRHEDLTPREMKFDLCSGCHKQFVRNPLGKDKSTQLNFSQN